MSTIDLGMNKADASLRMQVRLYKKRAQELEAYLSKKPDEWGRFQSEFNAEVNSVFRNIMNFERKQFADGNEDSVYKLKQIFIRRFRHIFARGVYCVWSIHKPYGYAGDFKIIDDIYQNNPTTSGFDRLFDNYFQMSAISVAVRNRKEDFKRFLAAFIQDRKKQKLNIMDLASGPCRELKEMFSSEYALYKNASFDCYENDTKAIEFSASLLSGYKNVNFFKENAIKMALKKDINEAIRKKYDLIYSSGLFDYFDERVATRLVQNLKKLLSPEGCLFIANVRDKYSNPSVHFMEWAGDWNLVYRTDDNFRKIFLIAGFSASRVKTLYEQQGIMQYIVAQNT